MKSSEERIAELEELVKKLTDTASSSHSRHRISYKTTADCIPQFDPADRTTTSTKWVAKIEQLAEINKWDEIIMIQHMHTRLTGMARSWYNDLRTYDYSWKEWKELIIKTFLDRQDFAQLLKTMLDRKKKSDELWATYYFEKTGLIWACEISEKNAVSCIIDGIDDVVIRTGAKAGRYRSPEELYS